MSELITALQAAGGGLLGTGLTLAFLIAAQGTQLGELHGWTIRDASRIAWIGLAVLVLADRHPLRALERAVILAKRLLGHRFTFFVLAVAHWIIYLFVAGAQWWSFNACSHDFGIMDEALANGLRNPVSPAFLHSNVLGHSLLGEHAYLLMAVLVPARAVMRSEWFLILFHAFVLWGAIFPLRGLLDRHGAAPWLRNFACLMYLQHPIVARTLGYLVHPEAAEPLLVLGLGWAVASGRTGLAGICLGLLLSVKEDVGLYVVGVAAWLVLARRSWGVAVALAGAGLAAFLFDTRVLIPHYAGSDDGYKFLGRWTAWGPTMPDVVLGWLTHPVAVLHALRGRQAFLLFSGLGFLPFLTRWGWLACLGPWLLNTSSSLAVQSGLGLYYGMPVLAFALLTVGPALKTRTFAWLTRQRWAPALPVLVALLNVSHLEFACVPNDRAAVIRELERVPWDAATQSQPSLYPLVGYGPHRACLLPESRPQADWILLRDAAPTWPFLPGEPSRLAERLIRSGAYVNRSATPGTFVLERIGPGPAPVRRASVR